MYKTKAIPFNPEDSETASVFDEAPLWSFPFGLMILNHINFTENARILDVGCGAGFPMIEIAQRFGKGAKVYGVDSWHEGLERLKYKAYIMDIRNIKLYEQKAEKLPFHNDYFDIIISNNGFNNVEEPLQVFNECYRTAKKGAQLIFTANLPGTMKLFYDSIHCVLKKNGVKDTSNILKHIKHKRKSVRENVQLAEKSGFRVENIYKDSFCYRFLNGTAFLNYYFVRLAFMESWEALVPIDIRKQVFNNLELLLNKCAEENNGITLQVPFACYNCYKP